MPTITVTSSYLVYPGETLSFSNEGAFILQQASSGPAPALTIRGTVDVSVTSAPANGYGGVTGISIGYSGFYDSQVVVEAGGVLRMSSNVAGVSLTGYGSGSWSPDFINHGSVEIWARGAATGLSTWDAGPWLFENTGTYQVTSTEGSATGISLANGGTFKNSGTFIVSGRSATGVGLNGWDSSFINLGTVRVVDTDAAADSVAVRWTSSFGTGDVFTNQGWIEGDYALRVEPYSSWSNNQELFTNNGTMVGKIDLGWSSSRLVNRGVIQGDVALGRGDDVYDGAAGVYVGRLTGGDGADSIAGGAAGEALFGDEGADTIDGGGGDDLIGGGRDADVLRGGDGVDTLTYFDATMALTLDMASGTASSSGADTFTGFERAIGGLHADTLSGAVGSETLSGGGGDDDIWGRAGSDSLEGGDGQDFLRGEDGDDVLSGGDAFDDLHGNQGEDTLYGGLGGDWVVGGQGNDVLFGEQDADVVYGNLGNDTVNGADGADWVRGGQGDDSVSAGAGDDYVAGDRGADTISGGAGADLFHTFSGAGIDRILDFNAVEGDRVNVLAGTTYTLRQEGADTIVDMGNGDQVILAGVQLSTLPDGWLYVG